MVSGYVVDVGRHIFAEPHLNVAYASSIMGRVLNSLHLLVTYVSIGSCGDPSCTFFFFRVSPLGSADEEGVAWLLLTCHYPN